MVPDWHKRPVFMQVALGAPAVYKMRASDCTPVEDVNILWALEGGLHVWAHNGVLFTYHGFSWRTFEGVSHRSSAYQGEDDGAGRSLPQTGAATGRDRDSILRRMVALRVPRGVEDDRAMDAQWFEHFRASGTTMETLFDEIANSSSAPPSLTTRPPWSASSLHYARRCEASTSCAPSLVLQFSNSPVGSLVL